MPAARASALRVRSAYDVSITIGIDANALSARMRLAKAMPSMRGMK
jgi:hypothetical protein